MPGLPVGSWQDDVRSELHAQAQRRRRQRRTPPGRPGHERQREGERPGHHPRQCRSLLRLCRFALAADEARRIRLRDRVLDRDACLADVAQPASGIPFEAAPHQLPHRRGSCGRQGVPGDLLAHDGRQHVRHGLSGEQPLARQHLVEHDAEGPDVRTLVDRPAARLLRAHVGRGAEDDSRRAHVPRQRGRERGHVAAAGARRIAVVGLGEAEIEDLHAAVGSRLDVGGLEVAVHDAALVGVLEPRRDLPGDRQRLVHRQSAPRQPLREVLALDQLEREREDSVRLLEPVDRADPRMVERGEDLRLAAEPGQALRLVGDLGREHLERDVAPELQVAGAEHLSHPARADRLEDLVVPDPGSRSELLHSGILQAAPRADRGSGRPLLIGPEPGAWLSRGAGGPRFRLRYSQPASATWRSTERNPS